MSITFDRGRTRLLYSQTRWLMRLRWVAGTMMMLLGAAHWAWLNVYDITFEPTVVGGVILAYNVVLLAVLNRAPRIAASAARVITFGSVQIHLDLVCLTLLTVWTGGVHSPVLPAYFFHMIFASLLQPRVRAYAIGLVAIGGVALGLWLSGQWPQDRADAVHISLWIVTLIVTVYLTDRVARALYLRERSRTRQIERIHALTATLRAQQDSLIQSEKMAAMGQLAAGIAHEINNPLASMDSVLQLMERRPEAPRPDAVATLREQVQRILRIVRQLTSYAHPGRGRLEILLINDVVRSSLDLLAFNRKADRVNVQCVLAEDAGPAQINPQALQQVIVNLLVNAFDATANHPTPHVTICTRREGEHCIIEVSDNGTGIAPEHLPRLFEPFFTTKPVGQGTGLGLSICARLLREQGGTITAHSELGQGASFTLRVPASEIPTKY